jgi:hypothetical protein
MRSGWWAAQANGDLSSVKVERAVRVVFLGLALFDLALGMAFTFFSRQAVPLVAPPAFAEPVFFQRCVGVFLFQYVFVQLLGFRNPRRFSTALTMTAAVRATFVVLYLAQLALWGRPFTVLHGLFAASAALDAAATIFVVWAMRRLGIGLLQGDAVVPPGAPSSKALRVILKVLGVGQLGIGLAFLFLPKRLCEALGIAFEVDPFWTRATGLFLVHIGFIQGLAGVDPNRYRSAAWTSGLFSALWPVLYWVSVAAGEGNRLFRGAVMTCSFFDLAAATVIFWLIRRISAEAQVGYA